MPQAPVDVVFVLNDPTPQRSEVQHGHLWESPTQEKHREPRLEKEGETENDRWIMQRSTSCQLS